MKNSILFIISILISTFTFAQSDKYIASMEKAIAKMDAAREFPQVQEASNIFERIMNAESKEWLPAYYTAYCKINLASLSMQKGEIDKLEAFINDAQSALDKALAIAPEESELHAMQGFIFTSRIWSDPMTLGAKFSPMAHESFAKAIALNPQNPRAYHLRGQLIFYTPEFWGGGPANAKNDLTKADELFASFESTSSIHPSWGNGSNKYHLSKIEPETEKGE